MAKRRRRTRRRSYGTRLALFGTVTAAAVPASGLLLWSSLNPFRVSPRSEAEVVVRADMGGFTPSVLRLQAGRPVTLTLVSLDGPNHIDGGGRHQLAVEALDVDLVAPARGSVSTRLEVSQPGVYSFYCDICCGGEENPSMQGLLVVEA